jgi:hypothetical protein
MQTNTLRSVLVPQELSRVRQNLTVLNVLGANPVAARSYAGSRVRIPLEVWMFVLGLSMLCCPV